jgi:hypothetical protein
MLMFVGVMTVIMAVGVALTERIDRPRRRQARLEATPAE